jgi:2-amino-4-hydroxy-6-hydroxymethyldihydropteridine diphosphokinase
MNEESQSVYLSLGSNLGDRQAHLREAVSRLSAHIQVDEISSLYRTNPIGVTDQPLFLNIAVRGHTALRPLDLLQVVKEIEQAVGREPTYRWGPRVVDIDILLLGELEVNSANLTIPHRELRHRAFVLVPLAEIAPALSLPGDHAGVAQLAASLDSSGVHRIGPLLPSS